MAIAVEELQRMPEREAKLDDCCGGTFSHVITLVPITCVYITIGVSTCHSCTNTDN